jgi:hypothetical protein
MSSMMRRLVAARKLSWSSGDAMARRDQCRESIFLFFFFEVALFFVHLSIFQTDKDACARFSRRRPTGTGGTDEKHLRRQLDVRQQRLTFRVAVFA